MQRGGRREERQKDVLNGFVLSLFLFFPQPSGAPVENDPLGPLPPGWGKFASHTSFSRHAKILPIRGAELV